MTEEKKISNDKIKIIINSSQKYPQWNSGSKANATDCFCEKSIGNNNNYKKEINIGNMQKLFRFTYFVSIKEIKNMSA